MKEIRYQDGKPVQVEVDPVKELQKDLVEPKEQNAHDTIKSALYADAPKAKLKMDRSITARSLNQTLESFSQYKQALKNEAVIIRPSNHEGWSFEWDRQNGVLKTVDVPQGKTKMQLTSKKLTNLDIDFVNSQIQQHLDRNYTK